MNSLLTINKAHTKWANDLIHAQIGEGLAEDVLNVYFFTDRQFENPDHGYGDDACLNRISCDYYDHSLELYISGINTSEQLLKFYEEKINTEFIKFIYDSGCGNFWINFTDESETQKLMEIHIQCGKPKGKGDKLLITKRLTDVQKNKRNTIKDDCWFIDADD